jgi:hypothetical protein
MPDPADLRHGGDDHHAGGDVDVEDLEGDKKEDDREQVEEKFHGNYNSIVAVSASACRGRSTPS